MVPALRGGVRVQRHGAGDLPRLLPAMPPPLGARSSAGKIPQLRWSRSAEPATVHKGDGKEAVVGSSGRGARLPRQGAGSGEQWGGRVSILKAVVGRHGQRKLPECPATVLDPPDTGWPRVCLLKGFYITDMWGTECCSAIGLGHRRLNSEGFFRVQRGSAKVYLSYSFARVWTG